MIVCVCSLGVLFGVSSFLVSVAELAFWGFLFTKSQKQPFSRQIMGIHHQ